MPIQYICDLCHVNNTENQLRRMQSLNNPMVFMEFLICTECNDIIKDKTATEVLAAFTKPIIFRSYV